jgi:hypothetical protein
MHKNRLEAFSDGVLAIPLSFVHPLLADAIYIAIAFVWLIPDRRIEHALAGNSHPSKQH